MSEPQSTPVPKPQSYPKERRHLLLPMLIERYREVSAEEAPGLIRAITCKYGACVPVVEFLVCVGNEVDIVEPSSLLRAEARTMLARKIAPVLLKYPVTIFQDLTDEMRMMVKMVVEFFAKAEKHSEHLSDQDLKSVQEFLGGCWGLNQYICNLRQVGAPDPLCESDDLIKALVYTKHFEFIRDERIFKAVPFLYMYLLNRYSHSMAELGEYAPRSIWLQGKYTADKMGDISAPEARLIAQDLMPLNMVCGYFLEGQMYAYLVPHARTLLQLVARDLAYYKQSLLPRG